mmetsp:Transcript_4870/g.9647  ORF Transcript_4870/g.9647 Transcript_4870/m.9647 type:complete len:161 (-) Transcript_4870:879-1361(-)
MILRYLFLFVIGTTLLYNSAGACDDDFDDFNSVPCNEVRMQFLNFFTGKPSTSPTKYVRRGGKINHKKKKDHLNPSPTKYVREKREFNHKKKDYLDLFSPTMNSVPEIRGTTNSPLTFPTIIPSAGTSQPIRKSIARQENHRISWSRDGYGDDGDGDVND